MRSVAALEKYIHRVPKILTGQDTNFMSDLLQDLYQLTLVMTTSSHPQMNGLIERFNLLKQMSRKTMKRMGQTSTFSSIYIS